MPTAGSRGEPSDMRFTPISANSALTSMPMKRRPIPSAATPVLPDPANGSSTRSPGFVLARRHLSISATGFCVGCFPKRFSARPAAVNRQTVFICLPPFSRRISS